MRKILCLSLLAGALSALLLELPFPIAGPAPLWRTAIGWIALVPLLAAILNTAAASQPHFLRHSAIVGYLAGILWYLGNCYWIYQTMFIYGGVSAAGSAGILVGFGLVLGLYFALFAFLVALVRKAFRSALPAALLAPFFWVAVELAASRITSVPWDQLGYSQIDNFLLTRLAPFTGVYGISFVLAAVNAIVAAGLVESRLRRGRWRIAVGLLLAAALQCGTRMVPPAQPTQATAVMIQPNLIVNQRYDWDDGGVLAPARQFSDMSGRSCGSYIAGMPETKAPVVQPQCPQPLLPPDLIVWPESPAPFREWDPRFRDLLSRLARENHASVVAGNTGIEASSTSYEIYNSAAFVAPDGNSLGRYDKIHLVPFGEYVPFKELLFFAHHLTQNVSDFGRGRERKVFRSGGHRYGVFICYESIFADEVRQFAAGGAEVFVNISDDGWYGDTSAPWQHLNIARMRAVENRRWIVRDTNSGITTVIDPYGRLTASAPRHRLTSLAASYGFRDDVTFYAAHGDVFAALCAIIALAAAARALRQLLRRRLNP